VAAAKAVLDAVLSCCMSCRTYTWIDGDEARARVSYVLASGAVVAFGKFVRQLVLWAGFGWCKLLLVNFC
jgi:hypothetical protein